jgi:NADH:ubiquinone oxidoreductase subunit 2 (subunit N)
MTIVAVVVIAAGAASVVLALRTHGSASTVAGVVGWIAVLAATVAMSPAERIEIGDGVLAATPYGRLVLVATAGGATLLALVAAAARVTPVVSAAGLAGVAAMAVAVTAVETATGAWAITAGALAALVVGLVAGRGGAGAMELRAALRATAIAGCAAVVAVAILGATPGDPSGDASLGGLAVLAAGAGLAIRAAAVPFHRWAARLADVAPRPILAPLVGWLPAVAVVVTLAWADVSVAPIAEDIGSARGILVAVALTTLALGGLASWLADDLAHTVTYAAIAAAGVGLLGVSALDPATWAATRSVALVGALTTTGLVAWVVAIEGAYRTRRSADLTGWARRSPVLAVALVLLAVSAVGLPFLPILEARLTIVDTAIDGPLVWPARLLLIAPIIGIGRVVAAGVRRPDPAIIAGAGERPVRPRRPDVGDPVGTSRRVAEELAIAWASISRNAALVASSAVLAISIVALVLAGGGLALPEAAAGPPPGVDAPLDPGAGPAPPDVEPTD